MREDWSSWPFVPGGREPIRIARAEGAYLYTDEGRSILDAAGGAIAVNVGHGRSEVVEAVSEALQEVSYTVPTFATPQRDRLVQRLRDSWLPPELTRVYLASGGSEAVEAALRTARQHHVAAGRPKRTQIIARHRSYHGATLATLGLGGHVARRSGLEPMFPAFRKVPECNCLRCPLAKSYPDCEVACAAALDEEIDRLGPENVAAFVAEPIVGASGGALVPPAEYWPAIQEICRTHGVLLIIDEVMTGFGRTGRRFGIEHFGVKPDILVSGKGLASGYAPISGVFATDAVVEPLAAAHDQVMFYTFGALPAACAAADSVLAILEREDLVRAAAENGEALRKRLRGLESHPNVAEIRGRGLLIAVELVRNRETLERFPAAANLTGRIVAAGLRDGVFFYPGGIGDGRNLVMLGPPFGIGAGEIERIGATLEAAIDESVARTTAELER
jgi:adenosylmethionine-8-amino-7-oxononanoate aminotransferase